MLILIILLAYIGNVVNEVTVCTKSTCYHNGVCVETSIHPGFKCRCSGTGYYGDRCQHACPTPGVPVRKTSGFPFECVVI